MSGMSRGRLSVNRATPLDVGHDAVVGAEPFEQLELVVAELFDDGE